MFRLKSVKKQSLSLTFQEARRSFRHDDAIHDGSPRPRGGADAGVLHTVRRSPVLQGIRGGKRYTTHPLALCFSCGECSFLVLSGKRHTRQVASSPPSPLSPSLVRTSLCCLFTHSTLSPPLPSHLPLPQRVQPGDRLPVSVISETFDVSTPTSPLETDAHTCTSRPTLIIFSLAFFTFFLFFPTFRLRLSLLLLFSLSRRAD